MRPAERSLRPRRCAKSPIRARNTPLARGIRPFYAVPPVRDSENTGKRDRRDRVPRFRPHHFLPRAAHTNHSGGLGLGSRPANEAVVCAGKARATPARARRIGRPAEVRARRTCSPAAAVPAASKQARKARRTKLAGTRATLSRLVGQPVRKHFHSFPCDRTARGEHGTARARAMPHGRSARWARPAVLSRAPWAGPARPSESMPKPGVGERLSGSSRHDKGVESGAIGEQTPAHSSPPDPPPSAPAQRLPIRTIPLLEGERGPNPARKFRGPGWGG